MNFSWFGMFGLFLFFTRLYSQKVAPIEKDRKPSDNTFLICMTIIGDVFGIDALTGKILWKNKLSSPLLTSITHHNDELEAYLIEPISPGYLYHYHRDSDIAQKYPWTLKDLSGIHYPIKLPDRRFLFGSKISTMIGIDLASGAIFTENQSSSSTIAWLGSGKHDIKIEPSQSLDIKPSWSMSYTTFYVPISFSHESPDPAKLPGLDDESGNPFVVHRFYDPEEQCDVQHVLFTSMDGFIYLVAYMDRTDEEQSSRKLLWSLNLDSPPLNYFRIDMEHPSYICELEPIYGNPSQFIPALPREMDENSRNFDHFVKITGVDLVQGQEKFHITFILPDLPPLYDDTTSLHLDVNIEDRHDEPADINPPSLFTPPQRVSFDSSNSLSHGDNAIPWWPFPVFSPPLFIYTSRLFYPSHLPPNGLCCPIGSSRDLSGISRCIPFPRCLESVRLYFRIPAAYQSSEYGHSTGIIPAEQMLADLRRIMGPSFDHLLIGSQPYDPKSDISTSPPELFTKRKFIIQFFRVLFTILGFLFFLSLITELIYFILARRKWIHPVETTQLRWWSPLILVFQVALRVVHIDDSLEEWKKLADTNLVFTVPNSKSRSSSSLVILNEILGYGSNGTVVFKGILSSSHPDSTFKRDVAVKRILLEFYHVAEHEISLLQDSDNHPNIIRYYYHEVRPPFLYIVLELCPLSLQDLFASFISPIQTSAMDLNAPPGFPCLSSMASDESGTETVDSKEETFIHRLTRQELDQLKSNFPTVKKLIMGLVEGLAHLHDLKICHRDIKPGNALISSNSDRILLSDFGLSKRVSDVGLTIDQTKISRLSKALLQLTVVGTVGWRAPEILAAEASAAFEDENNGSHQSSPIISKSSAPFKLQSATDIFSLGCLMFYTLTGGKHPFGNNAVNLESNILKGAFDLSPLFQLVDIQTQKLMSPEMSSLVFDPGAFFAYDPDPALPEAIDLISRMLSKEPSMRPTVRQVLIHPYFWNAEKRLVFLQEVSDRLSMMPQESGSNTDNEGEESNFLDSSSAALSRSLLTIVRTMQPPFPSQWLQLVDPAMRRLLMNDKRRKYHPSKIIDLLRALRNKKSHYQDLPLNVRAMLGSIPEGYLSYWTRRFPTLVYVCWKAVFLSGLLDDPNETVFKSYFLF